MRFTRVDAHAAALAAMAITGVASASPLARWCTSVQPFAVSLISEYDVLPILNPRSIGSSCMPAGKSSVVPSTGASGGAAAHQA